MNPTFLEPIMYFISGLSSVRAHRVTILFVYSCKYNIFSIQNQQVHAHGLNTSAVVDLR